MGKRDSANGSGDAASRGSWDAITAAFARVYGDREPIHLGTIVPAALGGPDPLDGLSFYPRDDHWHVVSYGLTELHDEAPAEDGLSGFGFELTMRIEDRTNPKPGPAEPSKAPAILAAHAALLQHLARYVFSTKRALRHGESMQLVPEAPDPFDGKWAGVIFADDPEVPPIDAPNGRVAFVQVVGLTLAEFRAAQRVGARAFLPLLQEVDPLLVSRPARPCLMSDATFAARVEQHLATHGSTRNSVGARSLRVRTAGGRTVLGLRRAEAEALRDGLLHVVAFGRTFGVLAKEASAVVVAQDASEENRAAAAGATAVVVLGRDDARRLAGAFPTSGSQWQHPDVGALTIEIDPEPQAPTGGAASRATSATRDVPAGKKGCLGVIVACATALGASAVAVIAALR